MPVEKRLCAFFAFRSQVTNAQRMWLCWDDLAARWAAPWAKFQFVWKEGPSTMCSHSLPNPKPQFGNEAVLKATPQKLKPWKKARQHSAAHLLLILGSSKGCQLHQLQELAHSCLGSGPGLRLAAKLCTHPVCQSDVHRNGIVLDSEVVLLRDRTIIENNFDSNGRPCPIDGNTDPIGELPCALQACRKHLQMITNESLYWYRLYYKHIVLHGVIVQ